MTNNDKVVIKLGILAIILLLVSFYLIMENDKLQGDLIRAKKIAVEESFLRGEKWKAKQKQQISK